MFETPPLEINFLRKASSYARDELETSALSLTFRSSELWRKAPYSFLRFKTSFRDSWGTFGSPRILPPPVGSSTYARDDFQSPLRATAVPSAAIGSKIAGDSNLMLKSKLRRSFPSSKPKTPKLQTPLSNSFVYIDKRSWAKQLFTVD